MAARFSAAVVLAALLPVSVMALDPATCAADDHGVLGVELAGWNDRKMLTAGVAAGELATAQLTIGQAVDARLARTPDVRYPVRPEKPGGSVSYGGLFAFTVEQAGHYRVALGSAAWIDVLKGDDVIASSKFGRGPECTDVRKMVDFDLSPGSYVLMIAANGQADLPLLVTRMP